MSSDGWREAIAGVGYEPFGEPLAGEATTVAMAPLVELRRLRRSLEHFCRDLGVRVVTTGEQLAHLGQHRLERIHALASATERVKSYLRVLSRRVDTLVVPLADGFGGLGGKMQLLTSRASGRAPEFPHLICIHLEGGRREVRARLIELGVALTGDTARAEAACERALALL